MATGHSPGQAGFLSHRTLVPCCASMPAKDAQGNHCTGQAVRVSRAQSRASRFSELSHTGATLCRRASKRCPGNSLYRASSKVSRAQSRARKLSKFLHAGVILC
eukprot:1157659-Pelagomonas_calceolata.AAC.8